MDLLGLLPPVIALFGVADLVGGAWSHYCLRSELNRKQLLQASALAQSV